MTEYYPQYNTGSDDDDEVEGYGYVAYIIPIMATCGRGIKHLAFTKG